MLAASGLRNLIDNPMPEAISFCMLESSERDDQVEFVATQLTRVRWISGYDFLPGKGYSLNWLPEGGNRMRFLNIVLKNSKTTVYGLDQLNSNDPLTDDAIRDFWNACLNQLALNGDKTSIPALVKIIESWKPRA